MAWLQPRGSRLTLKCRCFRVRYGRATFYTTILLYLSYLFCLTAYTSIMGEAYREFFREQNISSCDQVHVPSDVSPNMSAKPLVSLWRGSSPISVNYTLQVSPCSYLCRADWSNCHNTGFFLEDMHTICGAQEPAKQHMRGSASFCRGSDAKDNRLVPFLFCLITEFGSQI